MMYQRTTSLLLRVLKVPHEPQTPHGDPASLQVFRAGRNFYILKLVGWGFAQLAALSGIIFWLVMFIQVEAGVHERRQANQAQVNSKDVRTLDGFVKRIDEAKKADPDATVAPATTDPTKGQPAAAQKPKGKSHARINGWAGFKVVLVELALILPWWAFPLLWALKITGIVVYLVQLPVTFLVARLDYELRWYMVTDRSLRLRVGVWNVAESTMSFANIQQVLVTQGPVQRLLGLADVRVQSAGGGGSPQHQKGEDDLHQGRFHSVTNAPQIRDLILERLRRYRESGLGDPEEAGRRVLSPPERGAESAPYPLATTSPDLLTAARELAAEARALRNSLG